MRIQEAKSHLERMVQINSAKQANHVDPPISAEEINPLLLQGHLTAHITLQRVERNTSPSLILLRPQSAVHRVSTDATPLKDRQKAAIKGAQACKKGTEAEGCRDI